MTRNLTTNNLCLLGENLVNIQRSYEKKKTRVQSEKSLEKCLKIEGSLKMNKGGWPNPIGREIHGLDQKALRLPVHHHTTCYQVQNNREQLLTH